MQNYIADLYVNRTLNNNFPNEHCFNKLFLTVDWRYILYKYFFLYGFGDWISIRRYQRQQQIVLFDSPASIILGFILYYIIKLYCKIAAEVSWYLSLLIYLKIKFLFFCHLKALCVCMISSKIIHVRDNENTLG
jgi:hypothetical protein